MEEARMVRQRAELQRRGISSYILVIVMRAVEFDEHIMARGDSMRRLNRTLSRAPIRGPGPRTAILLRCSTEESERIRRAARMRAITISGFVLHSLKRSWEIEANLFEPNVQRLSSKIEP